MLFVRGQRWISETEPELGLATVVQAEPGRVHVFFPATGETRTYASDNAPLKRVRFRAGDTVKTHADKPFAIRGVTESNGLIVYHGDGMELPEAQLSDRIELHGPEDRLMAGRFDGPADFELRRRTLVLLHRLRKLPVRGFIGGRIELIPHQLYIAQEVARRHAPRVMLSDEVGLGKTIEACLIVHRLLLSGRAGRVLVLVPETLVHQWFVEMLRRFNLWLNIFDEERCGAIEQGDPEANPFLDDQLVLASIDWLKGSPARAAQAVAAGWDVLVVDEAHHLQWSSQSPSREYQIVEALSRQAEGLLLLTATPEQLGIESHFARLRLLDPDRYSDFETFRKQEKEYRRVAEEVEARVRDADRRGRNAARESGRTSDGADAIDEARGAMDDADELLDLCGPGRVLFRNTRASMPGFPKRRAHLTQIAGDATKRQPGDSRSEAEWLDRLAMEFAVDAGDSNLELEFELHEDPRILWLAELLRQLESEKVLLICRSVEKAEAIDEALRRRLNLKMAVFHEGLTLVQRDRHAAWFAEPEGARLLICSEIGSEGRNFQLAHHLVLFDLPLNPELLEQRIGRLDRIGQTAEIHVHVPFLARSPQEVLARWYHQGLNAFEANLEGGIDLLQAFGRAVHDLALEFPVADREEADRELEELIRRTAGARKKIQRTLEQGRDRLLELNSFRPAIVKPLIEEIRRIDVETELEEYMLDVFERFGVHVEELAPRTWHLNPQGVTTDAFPEMPPDGAVATCDRRRAVSREDVLFLTWDHPMVTGAMELVLGSETGNCALAILPSRDRPLLLLQTIYVLEPIAAARLHVDRFLPATPIRVAVDHEGKAVQQWDESLEQQLRSSRSCKLIENVDFKQRLALMLDRSARAAEAEAATIRRKANDEVARLMNHEIERLERLASVNDHVRPAEIHAARNEKIELDAAIAGARVRLESVRIVASE